MSLSAAPARSQTPTPPGQTAYSYGSNRRILRLDFSAGTTTVVNTDSASLGQISSLAVRDDVGVANLLITDLTRGRVLFYGNGSSTAALVTSAIARPAGLSLDGAGNLFLVTQVASRASGMVWTMPRGGSLSGGYKSPVLVDSSVPSRLLLDTKIYPLTSGSLAAGDLLVLSQNPPLIFRYPKTATGFGSRQVFVPHKRFPIKYRPTGLALTPTGNLLVATREGKILRYSSSGARLTDFASGLGTIGGLGVGVQDSVAKVFVSSAAGSVLRFDFAADGTGLADSSVAAAGQLGAAIAPGAPTPAGPNVTIVPVPEQSVNFDNVSTPGLSTVRMLEFADNRPGPVAQRLRAFFPGDPALQAALPDVWVPPHLQAFRKRAAGDPPDGPFTGPPTFIMAVIDTTAVFSRTAMIHEEEDERLGWAPKCADSDETMQPRTFYVPEIDAPKSEPPIVEGPVFSDFSAGCGSNIGRGSRFSLWMTGRDSRDSSTIVSDKLDSLAAALQSYAPLIAPATLAQLQYEVSAARAAFDNGDAQGAIAHLTSFIGIIDDNPGSFTSTPANASGELIARADSLIFLLPKPFTPTATDTDGDGVPDTVEVALNLDPNSPDSDGDGTFDGAEDNDGDGLTNAQEVRLGTNPGVPDTDGNGVSDADEDADGDGLTNDQELHPAAGVPHTDPLLADTDGDGMPDGYEVRFGLNPASPADAGLDPDGDGLTNLQESTIGSDPHNPDTTPPVLVLSLPAAGATNVYRNTTVIARFSEGVQFPGPLTGSFKVLDGATPVAGSFTRSADGATLTFTPAAPLATTTTYTIQIQGIRDGAYNPMTALYTSSFTTNAILDVTPPNVVGTSPINGTGNVPTNAPFVVRFTEPMDPSSFGTTGIQVHDNVTNQYVAGSIGFDPTGSEASFVPAAPLGVGRLHDVTVAASVADVSGNPMGSSKYYSFTTGFSSDTAPPSLVGLAPANAETGVPTNAKISWLFDEPIDVGTATGGVAVTSGGAPIPGTLSFADGNRRVVFTPASLAPNTSYGVVAAATLKDVAGNALLNPGVFGFTTAPGTDTTAPSVSVIDPAPGSGGNPLNAVVRLGFSEPVNPQSVTAAGAWTLYDGLTGRPVPASVTVSPNHLTAFLAPTQPLQPFSRYDWYLYNFADLAGNLASTNNSFYTGATTDATPPTVVSVAPADGTTGVAQNARVVVRLSEPIAVTSVGSATAIQVSDGSGPVAGTTGFTSDRQSLIFTPSGPLAASTAHTVSVGGFTDVAGNAVTPFGSAFTTGAGTDATGPNAVASNPSNGASNVAVDIPTISVTFDEPVDPASVSMQVSVYTTGAAIAGTLSVVGNQATFTPASALPGATQIYVVVPYGVFDLSRNPGGYWSSTFTTAGTPDTTPPTIVSVTPSDGSADVSPRTVVTLQFSESLAPTTVTSDTVALFAAGVEVQGYVSRSADNRTVFLSPYSPLPSNTVVSVVATSAITDISGNPLADFLSAFTTGSAGTDTGRPSIVGQRPGNGAQGVAYGSSIVLYADEALDAASVAASLVVSQDGVVVGGATTVTDAGRVVEFVPTTPLAKGSLVQVFVTGATDLAGNLVYPYQSSFRVAPDTSLAAPFPLQTSPAYGATGVPTTAVVEIQYSEPLNPATVTNATVKLLENGSTEVPATVSLVGGGTIVRIAPASPLDAGPYFYIDVTTGIQDLDGQPPASPFNNSYFYTGSGVDTVPPNVLGVSPPDAATGVGVNGVVRVRFSEAVNPLSVDGTTIHVAGGAQTVTPSSIAFLSGNAEVVMVPHEPLLPSTAYTLTVSGVRDVSGNAVTPFSSGFTSAAGPDTVGPSVVQISPINGASGVPRNATLLAEMNEAVDPLSVDPGTFYLYDNFVGQYVNASRSVSGGGRLLMLAPAAPLGSGRQHYASTSSSIRDVTGNTGTNSSWYFTTGFGSDVAAPTVVDVNPVDGATAVPTNTALTILFSEPIDGDALAGVTLTQGATPVAVTRALVNANQTLVLRPVSPLAALSGFTLALSGVKDLAGNVAPPASFGFTTGAGGDLVPPYTTLIDPLPGAYGVALNAPVRLRFNERINPQTVTTGSFLLYDGISGVYVPATITVSGDHMGATLTPAQTLQPYTTYYWYLNYYADVAGNVTSVNATFTTGDSSDATAPVVVAVSPPDGASGVAQNAVVAVRLSEPVAASSVGANAVQVTAGGPVAGTVSLSTDRQSLYFTPAAPLAPTTAHTVAVGGFTDLAGNAVTAFGSTFTTGGTTDTTAPSVVVTSPTPGATGVAVSSTVSITWDETIDPASVSMQVSVYATGAVVAGTLSVSGTQATFTPTTALPGSTQLFVSVPYTVRDVAGNVGGGTGFTFTTAATPDTTPPTVLVVTPSDGSSDVSPRTVVTLQFSESLNPATINATTFALYGGGSQIYTYVGRSADSRTVILDPSSVLPSNTVITVVATSGITDLQGNPLADFASAFTTGSAGSDAGRPSIVAQRPGNGAQGVAFGASIVLYADEALDAATVPGALFVSQDGAVVGGTVSVTDGGRVVEFVPSSPLAHGSLVQVFVSGATDTAGNVVYPYQSSFRVEADTSVAAPFPIQTSPANGATGVPVSAVVEIQYSEPLNAATVTSANVKLLENGSTEVPATVSLVGGGRIVRIVPSAPLDAGPYFYINISSAIQDLDGQNQAAPFFNNYFYTGSTSDSTPPTVATPGVSPPDGATGVGVNGIVRVRFSEPVNPLSVDATTLQIAGGAQTVVPSSIAFLSGNSEVAVVPHEPLLASTAYTVTVNGGANGVRDVSGNGATPFSSGFTTAAGPDTAGPAVSRISPASNATNVPLNTMVLAQASEQIDPLSLDTSSVFLYDNTLPGYVAGNRSVGADRQTLYFSPVSPLLASHSFYSQIGYGMRDITGNTGYGAGWYFTTGAASDTTPPSVQTVVPADGSTAVPTNARFSVLFDEPIQPNSAVGVTLKQGATPIGVVRAFANGNSLVLLYPTAPLQPLTTYTVNVDAVLDLSGNPSPTATVATFTTGAGADLVAPGVSTTIPTNGASGVSTSATPVAQFTERIDPLTIGTTNFVLWQGGCYSNPVAGTVSVAADALSATFTPSALLAGSTYYCVQVYSYTDWVGTTGNSYLWTFTTGP